MNCHELKDAEQQQQRSGREHLQTQLSAATADVWTIRMVEHAASRHGDAGFVEIGVLKETEIHSPTMTPNPWSCLGLFLQRFNNLNF